MAKEFKPGETMPSGDGGGSGWGALRGLDDWGAHGESEKLREWVLEEQLGTGG